MKWRIVAAMVAFLMVGTAFAAVASAKDDTSKSLEMSSRDNFMYAKAELQAQGDLGITPSNHDVDTFTYTDGPFPAFEDDGIPPQVNHIPWGSHYISDIFLSPPHNPGGWYSTDATGGVGEFAGGDTHESWIGDQNGNNILEWVAGFSYKTWGEDGIDNDGDGCIDEKTYPQWDPSRGTNCDMIPDQITYYETGGLVDPGGDDGDLLTNVDWFSEPEATEVWRAFVSTKWSAYRIRGVMNYPQWAGEHISYYAFEGSNGVNANPEMDSDQDDWYVGNIDARDFPARPPKDQACAAGYQLYMGITFKRDDGWVVTSFELREYYDGKDWNGDGDTDDSVAAYYAIDPITANCRENAVNTGVHGVYPRNTGTIMTPGYTSEYGDSRDWDQSGYASGYRQLYHDIESTWQLKGKVYTSSTFTYTVPRWGFGWWALYNDYYQFQTFPLRFGVAFYRNVGYSQGYYNTFYVVTSDEDNDRHSVLPRYYAGVGQPLGAPDGRCIEMYTLEYYAYYAGLWLMPTVPGDANGDGDYWGTYISVFCPEERGGGGSWIVEPTSKYAKGLYRDPIPAISRGYAYYSSHGTDSRGLCILLFFDNEYYIQDDADGNLIIENVYFHYYYWIWFNAPNYRILDGSKDWKCPAGATPGGTIIGSFALMNTGRANIRILEDGSIENDKGFGIQGLVARDSFGPDGVVEPRETATFHFAMTVSAGAPIGPLEIKIILSLSGVTKEFTMTLPIELKMLGGELACHRHSQNALRTLRAFDMDDDEGMLHNLIPGDLVDVDGLPMTPEDAILLMISWFENGCGGGDDIEHAHSVSAGLTGKYGMGAEFWGFAPGQEEGNEGNGNSGLTGQDRKDVYGF